MAHLPVAAPWIPRPALDWCFTPAFRRAKGVSPSYIVRTVTTTCRQRPCHATPPLPVKRKSLFFLQWDFMEIIEQSDQASGLLNAQAGRPWAGKHTSPMSDRWVESQAPYCIPFLSDKLPEPKEDQESAY